MNDEATDRTAKWLVGDRLACVLHLGDGALAYRLAAQGHDVVVAGNDVTGRRHSEIDYVRSNGERLPFVSESFDAVVVPELRDAPMALSEYARVLRPDGLVSTMTRRHDESVPWVRRLRDITGRPPEPPAPVDTFSASGLFHEPQTHDFAAWEQLDQAGLLQFARATSAPGTDESAMARVNALFTDHASGTGHLRLRHQTHCVRARVDKTAMTTEPPPPDTLLLDLR